MEPRVNDKLSDQLRALVEQSPMTRYRISQLTGISQAVLCKFVQGERGISTESWDKLGECLGLRLVADDPTPKRSK